jgi:hypothetical protein
VSSPMRRTLQTTLLGLEDVIKSGIKVEVDGLWQGGLILFFSLIHLFVVCLLCHYYFMFKIP